MLTLLAESTDLLIVDKPAGLPSVARSSADPSSGQSDHAEARLQALRPDLAHAQALHRLDTDTSGCLVFAKNSAAFERLRAVWAENNGVVGKYYRAIVVAGPLTPALARAPFVIDAPIAHHNHSSKRMIALIDGRSRHRGRPQPARTEVLKWHPLTASQRQRLGVPDGIDAFDLELRIVSGARHQIRVHLASLGHPVFGDVLYSPPALRAHSSRLWLHAWRVQLPELEAHAPLPWSTD